VRILHAAVLVIKAVVWRPHRLAHKQAQCLHVVVFIEGEAVVDTLRKDDEVPFFRGYANPAVLQITNVKVACAGMRDSCGRVECLKGVFW
jgi:hypothetical protein